MVKLTTVKTNKKILFLLKHRNPFFILRKNHSDFCNVQLESKGSSGAHTPVSVDWNTLWLICKHNIIYRAVRLFSKRRGSTGNFLDTGRFVYSLFVILCFTGDLFFFRGFK